MKVHPKAIIHEKASLGSGVSVGPYCTVGEAVEIGADCELISHVVLGGPTRVGEKNRFFPYASVGLDPQDLKYKGEPTRLEIGDHNTFREFVTVHRGTEEGGGVTRIGNHNLLMAYCHVAHDCQLAHHIVMANGAALGGHVTIEDYVVLGAYCGIHQFSRIGRHSFIGAYTPVNRDVVPFSMTTEDRKAEIYGVNVVGLDRRGFSKKQIHALRAAFRLLTQPGLNTSQAVDAIEEQIQQVEPAGDGESLKQLVEFIRAAKKGIVK